MENMIEKQRPVEVEEIMSLNIDDLDVAELDRRLEMAVATMDVCVSNKSCSCASLTSCGTFCAT